MKDLNDLLLEKIDIHTIPVESIDIYVAKEIISDNKTKSGQEKAIEKYARTIRSPLIKADLAKVLAEIWGNDLQDVKEMLSVNLDDDDSLLGDISTIEDGINEWEKGLSDNKVSTLGWEYIDDTLDNIASKEIILLAAPSGNGKSEMAVDVALNWIVREKQTVLYCSLEMSKAALSEIFVRKILKMTQFKLRELVKTEDGKSLVETVKEKISKYLLIIDKSDLDMEKVDKYMLAIKNSGKYKKVEKIVFDHFHLIANIDDVPTTTKNANKCNELVKKYDCNMLLLAQFNKQSRDMEKMKKFREYTIADLKGGVALEQIIHTGLICWREYKARVDLSDIEREERKYWTRVKIDKHRRGIKKGIYATLLYNKDTTRMIDITGHEDENRNLEEL